MPSVNSPPRTRASSLLPEPGRPAEQLPGPRGQGGGPSLPGYPVPANLHVFAHSPAAGARNRHGWSDAAVYLADSGAGVLNLASMIWLQAQADPRTPESSRSFALKVTQNIVRAVAAGPLGKRISL